MIKDIQLADCFRSGGVTLERVKYFQRQLLTVDDMVTDQDYFRQKQRRHNRFLHGWGVVCGLAVFAAPLTSAPWRVRITAGYALGPFGDEIYVGEPAFLDLAKCGAGDRTDPCNANRITGGRGGAGGTIYVAIEYAECFAQPVRGMPPGCGCEDDGCEYSRIRDSFELGCLSEAPPIPQIPLICNLLQRHILPECPPCPTSPWVALAKVTLPAATSAAITEKDIDNFSVRKQLYRTELLQEQLIRCCCGQRATPPARVTSVNPATGATFTNTGPASVVVTFNKSVQPATVNTATFTVSRTGAGPVEGSVTYNEANRTATFTPSSPFITTNYVVTVHGSGTQTVIDIDDLALDGNADGKAGDDFTSTFSVNKLT